jgi:hypothetical protein
MTITSAGFGGMSLDDIAFAFSVTFSVVVRWAIFGVFVIVAAAAPVVKRRPPAMYGVSLLAGATEVV